VGSRALANRAEIQAEWKELLRRFHAEQPVAGLRAAGPEITGGDQVQLLLRVAPSNPPGTAALTFLRELTEDLSTPIRFGLGLGGLTTPLGDPIHELDGPCFHHARRAIELAKHGDLWAVVAGLPAPLGDAANAILRLTGSIRAAWTDRQREVVRVLRRAPSQKSVAEELDVSPSVVSEVLKAARHDAVVDAEHVVEILINRAAVPEQFAKFPKEDGT
jgi:hypothetical protein